MPRLLAAFLLLAACTDPTLHAGLSIGPDGARIRPALTTGIEGGGTITYRP